jgi:hypothetical protein
MARYKMTVIFDVHEEVAMKYVVQESLDGEKVTLAKEVTGGVSYESDKKTQPARGCHKRCVSRFL